MGLDTNIHGIDLVISEYFGFSIRRDKSAPHPTLWVQL